MNTTLLNTEPVSPEYIKYLNNLVLSTDPVKNDIMIDVLNREIKLLQLSSILSIKYLESVSTHNYSDVTVLKVGHLHTVIKNTDLLKRANDVMKRIDNLLDGTDITKDEYEEAKKNIDMKILISLFFDESVTK